jgi:aquaporin Z
VASGLPGYSLAANGLGQNGFGAHSPAGYSLGAAFIAEVVLTAIFLLVILGATSAKAAPGFAGVAIGLTLTMLILAGLPITGVSVNPARSFGPAVIAGGDALAQLWVFILAPITGGILGAVLWKHLLKGD